MYIIYINTADGREYIKKSASNSIMGVYGEFECSSRKEQALQVEKLPWYLNPEYFKLEKVKVSKWYVRATFNGISATKEPGWLGKDGTGYTSWCFKDITNVEYFDTKAEAAKFAAEHMANTKYKYTDYNLYEVIE